MPTDNKQKLVADARAWLEANTSIRWTIPEDLEDGLTLEEANRRQNKRAGWLAAFAADMLAAERARVEAYEKLIEYAIFALSACASEPAYISSAVPKMYRDELTMRFRIAKEAK